MTENRFAQESAFEPEAAMIPPLDRLAEREAPGEAHLRALSEDREAFIDCVAEGGDLDAVVAARGPPDPITSGAEGEE